MNTFLKNLTIVALGIFSFAVSKKTKPNVVLAFRKLHFLTNGRFNDFIHFFIRKFNPKINFSEEGLISEKLKISLPEIKNQLVEDGYYIFNEIIPKEICESIYQFALSTPADTVPPIYENEIKLTHYDPSKPLAGGYLFRPSIPESALMMQSNRELQKIIFDTSLSLLAQEYLGCSPILVAPGRLWWSTTWQGNESKSKLSKDRLAQFFHTDMARIKFLKFFVYLTDVSEKTGPFCFIKGSHKQKPRKLSRDGRISDREVARYYTDENFIEFTAKKGSIIAVDSRGLHKGKTPSKNHRLIFELEYANSLFVAPYYPCSTKLRVEPNQKSKISKYPRTFGPLFKNSSL